MVRLLWVSRHALNEKNHEILKKAFNDYEVYQYSQTVRDVSELVAFADQHNIDAYIVVLPPHIVQQLLAIDRRPIYRFVVERIDKGGNEVEFVPVGLERILRIEVVTERVV